MRGTHIIEYVMRCCNVGSIVLVLVSLYVRTLDGREHWCIEFPRWSPIYSLFSDFGSKIPEESAMPDRTFGGIVRAYALPLPELLVSLIT